MVIERKGGRTFSLRVLLRANFVFLFSKFSSVLSSLNTVPLCCSFSFSFFSQWLFARLLVTTVCFFHGGFGHREDALFEGTNTQSYIFG